MGYDFTRLDLPDDVALLQQRASDYFEGDDESKDAVQQYWDAVEPYTFHLNLAAVGRVRSQMESFEMLAQGEPIPFPEFPTPKALSIFKDRLRRPQIWREYDELEEAASCQHGEGTGIARFKLLSNGPWVITRTEIRESLDVYSRLPESDRAEFEKEPLWESWLAWIRAAEQGFGVS